MLKKIFQKLLRKLIATKKIDSLELIKMEKIV